MSCMADLNISVLFCVAAVLCSLTFSVLVIIDVGDCSFVDDNIFSIVVLIEVTKCLVEIDIVLLVLFNDASAVQVCAHLAVIASVELEHVTEGLHAFHLQQIKQS